jgi:polyisoprenoid-binding protein YceI
MTKLLIRFFFVLTLFIPIMAYAVSLPQWDIVSKDSSIIFTATQNGSPVAGQFKNFTGDINFDPALLDSSHIQITVDMTSLSTSYKEVETTLKTPEWFNTKIFPKAIFKANQFTKTGNNTYQAKGTLTIRDKTVPITLQFTLDEYTQTKAHATGGTVLKRTAFGIGTGEWSKTDEVKDDVKVDFTLSAVKK